MENDKSEYKRLREQNIKSRQALFADFKETNDFERGVRSLKEFGNSLKQTKQIKRYKRKRSNDENFRFTGNIPVNRRKSARLANLPPSTDGLQSDDEIPPPKIIRQRRKTISSTNVGNFSVIVPPEDITDADIANIAVSSTKKVYSANGSLCHQCRQKTADTKTCCRSGFCKGVRGQYCGPCLRGRYGESVAVALRDPNWSCPFCRDECNCSVCRTAEGKCPTGILAPHVREQGYQSVKHYLLDNVKN